MTSPDPSPGEWERLVRERDALRAELADSWRGLDAWSRDVLGVKGIVRRHPYLVAGGAAAAGALLVRLVGPPPSAPSSAAANGRAGPDSGRGPDLLDELRRVVVRAAAPWITELVNDGLAAVTAGPAASRSADGEPADPGRDRSPHSEGPPPEVR